MYHLQEIIFVDSKETGRAWDICLIRELPQLEGETLSSEVSMTVEFFRRSTRDEVSIARVSESDALRSKLAINPTYEQNRFGLCKTHHGKMPDPEEISDGASQELVFSSPDFRPGG